MSGSQVRCLRDSYWLLYLLLLDSCPQKENNKNAATWHEHNKKDASEGAFRRNKKKFKINLSEALMTL